MAKFRAKAEIDAVQLRWDTWNEVCELIGEFPDGATGVFLDQWDQPTHKFPGGTARIGFKYIDARGCEQLAVENDWIVKGITGLIFHVPAAKFAEKYDPVEAHYLDHEPLT